jgi:hypothetical protein
VEREPVREAVSSKKFKMRAAPNWETVDPNAQDSPDRLRINPDLIPAGMSAQWVTDSVIGQGVPQHRSEFERRGWTPVHQDDFDGQFNGMFMPKDAEGEINVEGLVLMMRPKEMTLKAERENKRKAYEQVAIKEAALTGGDLPGVSLDTSHPSARNANRIRKSREALEIPE